MTIPPYSFLFCVFIYFLSKILINSVTRNKVAWNESLSPVKHNNIIQGKILLLFQILNE